jgi:tellurite resistance protein TerB
MSELIQTLSQLYRVQLERYRNRPFLRATMAACALVSMASGSVSLRQRVRIDRLMETLDALKVFDPHEGVELFNELVDALKLDPAAGRQHALEVIAEEVSQQPEKARFVVRICLAVSQRDGTIPPAEWREVESLCRCLGVDPDSCGLDGITAQQAAPDGE